MPSGLGNGRLHGPAHDLGRFVEAQTRTYTTALSEIKRGAKRSHWMWFVFPQLDGLGWSETAVCYGIKTVSEARAYYAHPVLGPRYRECVATLQDLQGTDANAVFGRVDAMKLRSSLTLFERVTGAPLLAAAIVRWFGGVADPETIALVAQETGRATTLHGG